MCRGPIGYKLSPLAEEAALLLNAIEEMARFSLHPELPEVARLRQIIELMDVEIASRGEAMERMHKIIGYDNSDGKHSEPSPEDLAKKLVETRKYFLEDNQRLKAELEKALEAALL
jgi:hypothetical protein